MTLKSLSVVIPCYNEAGAIEQAVRSALSEATSLTGDLEILAVDGNSTDGTLEKLRALETKIPQLRVIVQPSDRRGHGRALLLGYEAASKEWIFQMDSDDQFDTTDLPKLAANCENFDFITGIRQNRKDPLPRLLLSATIRMFLLLSTGLRLRDPNCPFRLMRAASLRTLLAKVPENAIAPNIFLSLLARTENLRVKEVPVAHKERPDDGVRRQRFFKLAFKGLAQFLSFPPVMQRLLPFFAILAVVSAQQIPGFMSPPGRDAGSFAYAAVEICNGKLLYRDIWDHKPPFIFFLYAGIFKTFGIKMGAIVLFEILWATAASLTLLALMRRFFLFETAFWASLIFAVYFSSLEIMESFGTTELYSAACVLAGLYALVRSAGSRGGAFASGLLFSCALLFRQTALFTLPAAATALFLLWKENNSSTRELWARLGAALLGIALPAAAVVLYFSAKGALPDFYDQVFLYNFAYSQKAQFSLASSIVGMANASFKMFFVSPLHDWPLLSALCLAGLVLGLSRAEKSRRLIFITALVWLLFALRAVSYSGKFYGHYYLELFAPMALLSCFAIEKLASLKIAGRILLLALIMTASTFAYNSVHSAIYLGGKYSAPTGPGDKRLIAAWLADNSSAEDYVYFWGAESGINLLADRKAPSRYHYLYPLLTPGYAIPARIEEFIADLQSKQPEYIIDCSTVARNIPPIAFDYTANPGAGLDGYIWTPVAPAAAYIRSAYKPYAAVGKWLVYRKVRA